MVWWAPGSVVLRPGPLVQQPFAATVGTLLIGNRLLVGFTDVPCIIRDALRLRLCASLHTNCQMR